MLKQNTGLMHIGLRNSLITKILRTFFALILTFCILPESVQSQEMRVYSQGPGYRFLPQKQYNGIPVTIYNDSSKTYRNQFTLNIEIDGVADSFTLDSLLADQDSTIIFAYPNLANTLDSHLIKTYFSFSAAQLNPFSDTVWNQLIITDSLLSRDNLIDSNLSYINLETDSVGNIAGVYVPEMVGVTFELNVIDTLQSVDYFIKNASAQDTFKVNLYSFSNQPDSVLETQLVNFTDSLDGFKKITFDCFNDLHPGKYLIAIGKTDSTGNGSSIGATETYFDTSSVWLENETNGWEKAAVSNYSKNPIVQFNFNGNKVYPNLIASLTDSNSCEGNRHLFYKDTTFAGSIIWNGTSALDSFVNETSQMLLAEHIIQGSGCSLYDSIYSVVSDVQLFTLNEDTAVFCENDSLINIIGSINYNNYYWQLEDSAIINSGSSHTASSDTAGFYEFTAIATNQNEQCIQNDTVVFQINDKPLAIINTIAPICGNDSVLSLISSVTDTAFGAFSGNGVSNGFYFEPDSAHADSGGLDSMQIVYTRESDLGCVSRDTSLIEVGAYPVFSYNNIIPEVCDYDTLNLANDFNVTSFEGGGYFDGLGVDSVFFYQSSATTYDLKYYQTDVVSSKLSCSDSLNLSVVVNLTPTLSFDLGFDRICIDSTNVPLDSLAFPIGGVYSGNGVIPNGGLFTFIPSIADTGTHVVGYQFTTNKNCSASISDTLIVDSLPKVALSAIPDFCVDGDTLHLASYATPFGGIFSGSGVAFNSLGYVFDPDSGSLGSSNFVNYLFQNPISGCKADSTVLVTINNKPQVAFTALPDFCIGDSAYSLTQHTQLGGVFSGTGIDSGLTIFNIDTAGVGTHIINYTIINANGCVDSASQTTTINSLPVVSLSISTDTICFQSTPYQLSGGLPAGPGAGAYTGKNVSFNQFNAFNAAVGTDTITYTYTNPITGCINASTDTILITPLPQPAFSVNIDSICNNELAFNIGGGVPNVSNVLTETYSGVGITSGQFNPSTQLPGIYTITYTVVDSLNCTNLITDDITVNSIPSINFGTVNNICFQDTLNISASITGASSWQYKLIQGTTNTIHPITGLFNAIQTGSDTIQFSITDFNGCMDSSTQSIFVDTIPIVSVGSFGVRCLNGNPVSLNTGSPSGGKYNYKGGFVFGSITPTTFGAGLDSIKYIYSDQNGCTDSSYNTVLIDTLPIVILGALADLCINGNPDTLTEGIPFGGVYTSSQGMLNDSVFDPNLILPNIFQVVYTFTDGNGCNGADTANLVVNSIPVVQFGTTIPNTCINGASINLLSTIGVAFQATYPKGIFSGVGIDSAGNFLPINAGVGGHNINYQYTDGNGCVGNITDNIIVYNLPKISFVSPLSDLCLGEDTLISASASFSTDFIWSTGETSSVIRVGPSINTVYTVTITDQFTCSSADSVELTVKNSFDIVANFDTSTIEFNTSATLDLIENDNGYPNDIDRYTILRGPDNGIIDEAFNPEITYTPNDGFRRTDSVLYEICDNYCPAICDTNRLKIKVFGDPTVFIPNAISPNGDGINDNWFVPGITSDSFKDNELFIFNRNGNVVYNVKGYQNDWEGQSGGLFSFGSENLPDGTYYYVLKLNDGGEDLSGTIELKR